LPKFAEEKTLQGECGADQVPEERILSEECGADQVPEERVLSKECGADQSAEKLISDIPSCTNPCDKTSISKGTS
jgi:hypothetical protein